MGAETPPPAGLSPDGTPEPTYVTEDKLRDTLAGFTGKLLQRIDERLQPVSQFNQLISQYQQAAQETQLAPGQQPYEPGNMDEWVPRRELIEQQQRFAQTMDERDQKLRQEFLQTVQPVVRSTQRVQEDQEWSQFQGRYSDLVNERRLVRAIAQDLWTSQAHVLQNLTPEQIYERIARESRAEINRIRGGQPSPTPAPVPPVVTPGLGVTEPGVTPVYDLNDLERPLNDEADISELIDQRRAVRSELSGLRI